ncbi:hypothetical protein ASPZODRAFT_70724 [Penicilliopsis zonata CBS 506.65]|uniref:Major facilitator superfamily (MFS) profile domain-containing protein n=1 Tax=Penicilliopsis zonata CBS 506.65 TaxID=1073090 RepID=A0A1L9SDG6_9EURO|nr:hypothetical protein ASPZODRAFT_70724 [Penicilliopsis zonata CBS 506.65]OJJ45134.1 hypothetical protein ASPZODRAFT_70724 [Penicilliopsis zonata CBS 506.65]
MNPLFSSLDDSKEHPRPHKWLFTSIVSLTAAAAPLGSTILMPVLASIASDFHTSPSIANLSVAFYSLAIAFLPLWWSSLAELYGRRPVYLASFTLFIVFNILSAFSSSIVMFILMRVLAGGASASVQAVGAGTVADLWAVKERGRAMGIFFLGPMLGPLIAPIIGGAVALRWSWRSTQWVMVIYGVIVLLLLFFCLPETKHKPKQTPGEGEKPEQKSSIWSILVAPLSLLPMLRSMPIFITVYYASITFASYYLLNISVQATFSSAPYSFSTMLVGLMYVPSSLGYILSATLGGRWTDRIMHAAAEKAGRYDENNNLIMIPADRIGLNAWIAGLLYPAALLTYGWTAGEHVFWFGPCVATFFYGVGNMLVFGVTTTMLTEFVPSKPSTGVALNNLLRNSLACIACVVAQPLMDAIGNGWLFTGMAVICWLSGLTLVAMKRLGNK